MIDYIPGSPCPCNCGATGSKLSFKTGHVARTCECPSCRGRRNRAKGQRGQAKMHRALGGVGRTPHDEENHNGYDIRVQTESKSGYPKLTVKFYDFIATDFFRRALSQADRARRVGDGSMPAVFLDGRWLVVDTKRGQDGAA